MSDQVAALQASFEASCAAFKAKDIEGYLGEVHPQATTFQQGTFLSMAALRELAPAVLENSVRFDVARWIGGVVVGDAGAVWGEFEFEVADGEGGTRVLPGSFSAHYVREDGTWRTLFTHYTPKPV